MKAIKKEEEDCGLENCRRYFPVSGNMTEFQVWRPHRAFYRALKRKEVFNFGLRVYLTIARSCGYI